MKSVVNLARGLRLVHICEIGTHIVDASLLCMRRLRIEQRANDFDDFLAWSL